MRDMIREMSETLSTSCGEMVPGSPPYTFDIPSPLSKDGTRSSHVSLESHAWKSNTAISGRLQ
jgi:hypothetical protein